VTDEEGMAVARRFGGQGWRLQDAFGSPAALRDWLALAVAPPKGTLRPSGTGP
jgi:trehalose 6-phosphate phosphatase